MSPLDDPAYLRDPAHVRAPYASEANLAARSSLYSDTTGPFAGDLALAALAEIGPTAVLEVGCGTGWFAERAGEELGAEVVAVDQSERMVELAKGRGLDARVGDVQEHGLAANVPASFEPFDARRSNVVFVADT